MVADNVQPAMVADKYEYSEADDLYDQDLLTGDMCEFCGSEIYSTPACTFHCTNDNCESHHIRIDV